MYRAKKAHGQQRTFSQSSRKAKKAALPKKGGPLVCSFVISVARHAPVTRAKIRLTSLGATALGLNEVVTSASA